MSIAIITLFSFCIGRCIVDCICVPLSFKYRRLVVANVLHCYVFVVLFVVSCLWLAWMLLMGCIKFWLFFVAPPIVLLLVLIAARGRKGNATRKRERERERERRWDGEKTQRLSESPPQKRRLTVYCGPQVALAFRWPGPQFFKNFSKSNHSFGIGLLVSRRPF